jgi:hypothetical protein
VDQLTLTEVPLNVFRTAKRRPVFQGNCAERRALSTGRG